MDASPATIHMFRAIGVFWGTVLTCAVFVLPRILQVKEDIQNKQNRALSISVSGLYESAPLSPSPRSSAAFRPEDVQALNMIPELDRDESTSGSVDKMKEQAKP